MYGSTAPKPYRCSLNQGEPTVTALFTVVDTSDGDAVVGTYRNVYIAERHAALSPAYQVRDYSLKLRD